MRTRPGPGHGEARRHRVHDAAPSVVARRLTDDRGERSAEHPEAAEPALEADVGHRALRRPEQVHRPLDSAPLQVAVRGLTEYGPERADEVGFGHHGNGRQGGNVERLRIARSMASRAPSIDDWCPPPAGCIDWRRGRYRCTSHSILQQPETCRVCRELVATAIVPFGRVTESRNERAQAPERWNIT